MEAADRGLGRMTTYASRPISRSRRSRAEMDAIRDALHDILIEGRPMTVRQVFYAATTRGVIAKTEAEYRARGPPAGRDAP